MSDMRIRNEILWELESNEWDMDIMPHYGLTPDFVPRYHRLAKLVREYLKSEHTQLDEELRKAEEAQRHKQRETQSAETDITGC